MYVDWTAPKIRRFFVKTDEIPAWQTTWLFFRKKADERPDK
jgi:hypothetical protein